jgi:hypothetical protein
MKTIASLMAAAFIASFGTAAYAASISHTDMSLTKTWSQSSEGGESSEKQEGQGGGGGDGG